MSQGSNLMVNATYIYEGTMNIFMDYSIDGGNNWVNEFAVDTSENMVSIDYHWNLFEEFGWGYFDSVSMRAYATVGPNTSDTIFVNDIIVANIVGDYIFYPEFNYK